MPARSIFPDPRRSTPEGIVALGGTVTVEMLRAAYAAGIFPWPMDGLPLPWFCPPTRGILEFSALHVPRRLERRRRARPFELTIDAAFEGVIDLCAARHEPTWITAEIRRGYVELHRVGGAHSAEAWLDGRLVGGVYGVDAGAFACESMFYLEPDASKLALLHLIDHLRGRGLDWIDIQMVTPHMAAMGAREIARDEFLERLRATRARGLQLFDSPKM
jgi:leucyl/phenylalanyl-tRNA--protein transferase